MTFLSQTLIEDATKYPRWPRRYAVLNRRAKWRLSSKHTAAIFFLSCRLLPLMLLTAQHQARLGDTRPG
jgi:hypothetical protein